MVMNEKVFFYDQVAERYHDLTYSYDENRRLWQVFNNFLSDFDWNGKQILDIGCGTGIFTAEAQKRTQNVIGADISHRMLQQARKRGIKELVQTDMLQPCFKEGFFDLIISSEAIEHCKDPSSAIKRMGNLLAPGGQLILTVPNRMWIFTLMIATFFKIREFSGYENWQSRRGLQLAVENAGLQIVEIKGLHLYPFVSRHLNKLLPFFDRCAQRFPGLFVVLCVLAVKSVR